MKRREFLGYCIAAGMSVSFSGINLRKEVYASSAANNMEVLRNLVIADAHAHPYQIYGGTKYDSTTPTAEMMQKVGIAACSFSAVGDMGGSVLGQLKKVKQLEEEKKIAVILSASDLPAPDSVRSVPGAVMAIEGAGALEGKIENLEKFYDYGVRMMTIMHNYNNDLGFNQKSRKDGPLTPLGIQVVERMNKLGMIVDVAHSNTATLKSIAGVSRLPVIDSHTNPLPYGYVSRQPSRFRSWPEMEVIAKTGGLVCTWPYACSDDNLRRTTLKHWAEEISQMKTRLGIEHCGLGTDGGGQLPQVVAGWESIESLPQLIAAMKEAGLSQDDIALYVGGNFLQVMKKCLV